MMQNIAFLSGLHKKKEKRNPSSQQRRQMNEKQKFALSQNW